MNIRNLTNRFLGLLLLTVASVSCQQDKQTQQAEEFGQKSGTEASQDGFGETFYRIPSPEDMFDLVSKGKVAYKPEVLNPTSNLRKYLDTKSKEFNFGVYSADLAYTAAFQKYQAAYDYIETVHKLSNDVGISAVFDEALVARVHNIFANSDSLISVTNNTYSRFVRHLEQNDRGKTLAMVSAGGWVESLYIIVKLVGDYKENDPNVQRIADQKLTFENLVEYLMQFKDDPHISSLISELSSIKLAYDALQEVTVEATDNKTSGDKFVVGSGTKIVVNKAQYDALRKAIIDVRTKLTLN